jgi:SNF2 family DNA or RNA helicase
VSQSQVDPKDSRMKLFPHQAALVEAFFNPASKQILLLRSDVGLGVTAALVVLVGRLLHERPQARVLFLAPSALRLPIVERLRDHDVPSQLVDRYRFREMFESTRRGGPWPCGVASVLSLDFARQRDIRDSLAEVRWELVIVTEAHRLRGARAEALKRIITDAERAILATIPLPGLELADEFASEHMTQVVWQRDQVVGHDGKPLDAAKRPILHEVAFSLTPAEVGLRETLADLCRVIEGNTEIRNLIAKVLLGQLHSSPAALEGALQRLVGRLKVRDNIDDELGFGEVEDEVHEDEIAGLMDRATDENVARIAAHALQEMETITADSKLGAFGQLLNQLNERAPSYRRICVFTDYLATLYYLAAEIEGRGMAYELVHGAMSTEARHGSLARFVTESGILVATRAALVEGVGLVEVTDLVLYDLPDNRMSLQQLLGRFDRFGRKRQLTIHALMPSNGSDRVASERLALLRETLDPFTDGERGRR